MRPHSRRILLPATLFLACCAAALAVATGGLAGSTTQSSFDVFVQPATLSTSATGFAKGQFTAASGSGTGSATHVAITFHVPSALGNPTGTTSDCTTTPGVGENVVTCNVGTVNAGQTVRRFVTFTAPASLVAPPTPDVYTISGSVSWDNGSGGAGGGGGINSIGPKTGSTTVYAANDPRHAGNCFFSGTNTVSTPGVTDADNQSTSVQVGSAAAGLGLPCTFADVGEDAAPPGFDTQISHDTLPQLSQPARVTLTLYSLPVPFSQFKWLFSPDYPATLPNQSIPNCVNNQLPANAIVCLLSSSNKGKGGSWTFLQLGTGTDPAFGH
jgi:hypothetical protein